MVTRLQRNTAGRWMPPRSSPVSRWFPPRCAPLPSHVPRPPLPSGHAMLARCLFRLAPLYPRTHAPSARARRNPRHVDPSGDTRPRPCGSPFRPYTPPTMTDDPAFPCARVYDPGGTMRHGKTRCRRRGAFPSPRFRTHEGEAVGAGPVETWDGEAVTRRHLPAMPNP